MGTLFYGYDPLGEPEQITRIEHSWEMTHEIDVANCDIDYYTTPLGVSPTRVRNIMDRRTRTVGLAPDEPHSMSVDVDSTGAPISLRSVRTGDDMAIRIPCEYINKVDFTVLIVAKRNSRTLDATHRDILFSNAGISDGDGALRCGFKAGIDTGVIRVSGGITKSVKIINCFDQNSTKLDNVFCLSMHCNIGYERSHIYVNGRKMDVVFTYNYRNVGLQYLSVGSAPSMGFGFYSPDASFYLIRIIKGEMKDSEIANMHGNLMRRFSIT